MVNRNNIGGRNKHPNSGTYEFHIHRVYMIYGYTILGNVFNNKICIKKILLLKAMMDLYLIFLHSGSVCGVNSVD